MPIIELSTALVAAGSGLVVPFVNKVLEKSAQRLGGHVDEHLATLFTRAHEYLAATGREAQSVEPKLLKAVVENAPYETDPTLAEQWAALLANAADSAQHVTVPAFYTDILRQLTKQDTQVLRALYCRFDKTPRAGNLMLKQFGELTALPYEKIVFSVDNLLRLRLLVAQSAGGPEMFRIHMTSPSTVVSTPLGLGFMLAVTPPTA